MLECSSVAPPPNPTKWPAGVPYLPCCRQSRAHMAPEPIDPAADHPWRAGKAWQVQMAQEEAKMAGGLPSSISTA